MSFVEFVIVMFLSFIIHNVVIKKIYCKWKKKHQTKKRCYFWNCKEWHTCPYNYDVRSEE